MNPVARLRLQWYEYRAKHWVMVEGVAKVHRDVVDHVFHAKDSVYTPKGAVRC